MTFKQITITFLNNKKKENIYDYEVYINTNDEDSWIKLGDSSIGSYPRLLLKFVNKTMQNTFYVFFENVSFLTKDNIMNIKTFSQMNFYKKAKHKLSLNEEINVKKERVYELHSNQFVGWSIEEVIELENLEYEIFKLSMRKLLNLEEVNNHE
ncbi:hypothetical protein MBVR141_0860 [Mycoplasmopsis bovirhinis]|uniref:Uncharacterized protein n=1 Tax=Mycoplasmopsis bovirhinis TaxID=29553 RepID=A0A224AY97_9BACT|nr:hypothetical protein [Mycoplasmopsis bovirhinis]BBA22546.1 hypothetical protein MBVR141_0860 [Mycoplasmopsis bovirhinis]VEU63685.1 Uncharacterised protein [Mycoplasmopsis bovirhinis]